MMRRAACVAAVALTASHARADEPPEVQVRGDPVGAPPKEPSVAGGVIREERLRSPGLQASDALRTQPGLAVLETGGYGALSTASIRGATAAETPVYLAGIRLNDDVGGAADLSLAPLWLVRRIEIYRSNAPIEGDELGIGGAIFFEPRKPRRREATAGVMVGSFGAHAAWASAGGGDEDASALVGVRIDGARNDYPFVDDAGTRFVPSNFHTVLRTNADVTTGDVWALGSVRLGRDARADLVVNDVEREQGLPAFTLVQSTRARATVGRHLAGLTAVAPCARSGCVVTSTTTALLTGSHYEDPLREVALGTTSLDLDASRVESTVLVRWAATDRLDLTPVVRAAVERLAIVPAQGVATHAERVFGRAALHARWAATDWLSLHALGSADCDGTSQLGAPPWALAGDPTASPGEKACSQFEPVGRVGAEVRSGRLAFLATVGRYARVPTLAELYGISGAVRGNSALVPETGIAVEAGVRASAPPTGPWESAAIDLFAFARSATDLVSYEHSSLGYVVPFNLGSGRVTGVEVLAGYGPVRFARFELAATLLDPRNTSPSRPTNDLLPYLPRLTLAPRLELRSSLRAGPVDAEKVTVSYFYESSRYADAAGLVVIPAQGTCDVDVELAALRDRLALRGRVSNLFDQARFDLIGYPLPGRAAYAALEATW